MTDLDNTQIITADDSLLQNSSINDTEASLKIISGADSNTYQIGQETIIGRSNPSDLVISAPSLSKQHAKITYTNGQYFITDLGSSNKTFHNKVQLQPNVCYALHNGDEIKLGDIICLFEEQKAEQTNKNTFSETTDQTYVPVVNTLVEEDSPWPLDDDISSSPVITETNVDVIPSTQTISDSYDDEQPTQPMKIWNGNSNNTNRLSRTSIKNSDDVTPKQNGLASSFISPSLTSSNDVNDDNSLVIGGATLPATVPLVIESTQINNDDQLEIISSTTTSSQTKQVIEEDNNTITIEATKTTTTAIEIENTQAYTLEPSGETIATSNNQITETQPYELESEPIVTDVVETKQEEVHQVVIEGNTMIEEITTTTTTTTTMITDADNPIVQTLAYDLQPTNEESSAATTTTTVVENEVPITDTLAYDLEPTKEEITTITTTTTTTTVIANENLPTETLAYDLQPNNEQIKIDETAPAVCQDTQEYDLDEQIEDSPRPASETLEVVPVSKLVEQLKDVENIPGDATPKQQVEVIIDPDVVKEVLADEQMDTDQTDVPSTPINNEPITQTTNDEQQENTNKIEDEVMPTTNTDAMAVDEPEKPKTEVPLTITKQKSTSDLNKSIENTSTESEHKTEETQPSTLDTQETQQEIEGDGEGEEDEETEESAPVSGRGQRGVPRKAARRGRGRRGGSAARARVVSTRIHGTRRNAAMVSSTNNSVDNNATLEETVNTEPEESPQKSALSTPAVEQKSTPSTPAVEQKSNTTSTTTPVTPADETSTPSQPNSGSNIRVSARIKARASNGRNRQFPYTDDYVDLDDLEKQSKAANVSSPTTTTTTSRRSNRGGRSSSVPQKRISLRQQPIDASESPDEKNQKQKDNTDIYEQMDTGGENEEPNLSTRTVGRKRKSTTPVASTTTKRSRSTTPQTAPVTNTRRKQASIIEQPSPSASNTPKRGRKSTKSVSINEQSSPEKPTISTNDRPVRIALSSHLNFDPTHLDTLRKLGFEIMDESCQVDALVVDRIRRTKKFFMCLARGAHILSPTWIESMIKENRYIPYDKYYLEDTNAETRYGFQLRESVRLAKQHPIFENYKFFCTKDTSPPYDDLKDIIEAAGGKFIDKINTTKPGKDLICIVAQIHKNEYEDLYRKGVPIVSEEFALSGISKQKLDFESFSLFQPVASTTMKSSGSK